MTDWGTRAIIPLKPLQRRDLPDGAVPTFDAETGRAYWQAGTGGGGPTQAPFEVDVGADPVWRVLEDQSTRYDAPGGSALYFNDDGIDLDDASGHPIFTVDAEDGATRVGRGSGGGGGYLAVQCQAARIVADVGTGATRLSIEPQDASAPAAIVLLEGGQPNATANGAILYAEDNGSGKTRLMVRFPTGSPVQLAIEP